MFFVLGTSYRRTLRINVTNCQNNPSVNLLIDLISSIPCLDAVFVIDMTACKQPDLENTRTASSYLEKHNGGIKHEEGSTRV